MALLRSIGRSEIFVSPVAMGCWPIAGISSLHVNEADSVATLRSALDHGVTHFDTAHCYGYDGESELLIAKSLGARRREISLATKCGIAYDDLKNRITDGRRETLRRHCEISLRRLQTDCVELLYLHSPDPEVSLADSAGALAELKRQGKTIAVGISNATLEQIKTFHEVCPLAAVQLKYNLLQREIEGEVVPWCLANNVAVMAFWPLMKGLLAGQLLRNHVFDAKDPRTRYPIFRGELWETNQNFVDVLRVIAARLNRTVAQIALNWIIHRPGITAALCGAKRPEQISDNASSMGWQIDAESNAQISAAYSRWQAETAGAKLV